MSEKEFIPRFQNLGSGVCASSWDTLARENRRGHRNVFQIESSRPSTRWHISNHSLAGLAFTLAGGAASADWRGTDGTILVM